MLIYWLNFFSVSVYRFIIKNKGVLVFLITLQLFLILALRDNSVGVDLGAYEGMYNYIGRLGWQNLLSRLHFFSIAELPENMRIESGYAVFNWLIYQLGFSYHAFLVVCAAVTLLPVGWFIYKYSKNPSLSFLIYISTELYINNFGILRQSIAIGILVLSVPFILQKRLKMSLLFLALAFTFHRVSLLWLPLCFVPYITLNKQKFATLIAGGFVFWAGFFALGHGFAVSILSFLGKTRYIGDSLRYSNTIVLIILIIGLIYLLCDITKLAKDSLYNLLFWALIETFYFNIITSYMLLNRALPVLLIFVAVLVPNMLCQVRYQLSPYQKKLLHFSIMGVLTLVLFMYMIYRLKDSYIIPYRFY